MRLWLGSLAVDASRHCSDSGGSSPGRLMRQSEGAERTSYSRYRHCVLEAGCVRTMYSPSLFPHLKISRSIDATRTRNALAKPDTGSSSAPLARRRDLPKATRGPGRGGACVRPSPGRVRGRPEWPAHSRPLYFSRLSGATSAQSFGTGRRLPAFAFPPIPGQRRLLSSLLLLSIIIGLLLVLCVRARQEQAGRTAHCVLPDAGRTHPRMSPR